jgi:tetratricopeptide (TPR) repeat protein
LAPRAEKDLHKALQNFDVPTMERVSRADSGLALAAATLAGVRLFSQGEPYRGRQLLIWVFGTEADPSKDPFIAKYVSTRVEVEIVAGVTADLPLDRNSLGLALAEMHQEADDVAAAIDVVEQLEPTQFTALSLAELYAIDGRFTEIIELTNGIKNEDDCTALLVTFRGVALREQEYFEAAREAFKEALKSKQRSPTVRHRALLERARSYELEGKRAMARKDLERILAEDGSYEGLAEAFKSLET